MSSTKNIFLTKTALALYFAILSACYPIASRSLSENVSKKVPAEYRAQTSEIVLAIFGSIASALSLYARHAVGDVHTPRGLPGRDPE